jgi:hypothetical protein
MRTPTASQSPPATGSAPKLRQRGCAFWTPGTTTRLAATIYGGSVGAAWSRRRLGVAFAVSDEGPRRRLRL